MKSNPFGQNKVAHLLTLREALATVRKSDARILAGQRGRISSKSQINCNDFMHANVWHCYLDRIPCLSRAWLLPTHEKLNSLRFPAFRKPHADPLLSYRNDFPERSFHHHWIRQIHHVDGH